MKIEVTPKLNIFRVTADEGEELTIELKKLPTFTNQWTKVHCQMFDIVINKVRAKK